MRIRCSASGFFSLLEIILAMALSSIVIMLLMRSPKHLYFILGRVQRKSGASHSVGRAMSQMERDISSACRPHLFSDEIVKKKKEPSKDKSKKKKKVQFFIGTHDEDKIRSAYFVTDPEGSKQMPLLEKLSFVSTAPLETYGKPSNHLVRVTYELKKDKKKSSRSTDSFCLYRREDKNLRRPPEKSDRPEEDVEEPIKILILDNVRECFVEYTYTDTSQKKDVIKQEKPKPKKVFAWGKNAKTENRNPDIVRVSLAIWEEELENSIPYSFVVPVFASSVSTKPSDDTKKLPTTVKRNADAGPNHRPNGVSTAGSGT